jgi:hypothetical protein
MDVSIVGSIGVVCSGGSGRGNVSGGTLRLQGRVLLLLLLGRGVGSGISPNGWFSLYGMECILGEGFVSWELALDEIHADSSKFLGVVVGIGGFGIVHGETSGGTLREGDKERRMGHGSAGISIVEADARVSTSGVSVGSVRIGSSRVMGMVLRMVKLEGSSAGLFGG